jgi:hypothetical protein
MTMRGLTLPRYFINRQYEEPLEAMTTRTKISLLLLSLIFPAQEFWQLWDGDNRDVNWWIALDYPYSIQWYMHDMGAKVSNLLYALVIHRISFKIQALKNAATVILIFALFDLLMFFYCNNRASYTLFYTTVGLSFMVSVIFWPEIKTLFRKSKVWIKKTFQRNKISHA